MLTLMIGGLASSAIGMYLGIRRLRRNARELVALPTAAAPATRDRRDVLGQVFLRLANITVGVGVRRLRRQLTPPSKHRHGSEF